MITVAHVTQGGSNMRSVFLAECCDLISQNQSASIMIKERSRKRGACVCVGCLQGASIAKCPARALPSVSNCDTVIIWLWWIFITLSQLLPSPPAHPGHPPSSLRAPGPLNPRLPPFPELVVSSLLPWPRESRLTDHSSRHSLSKFNTTEKQASSEQTNRSSSCPLHSPSVQLFSSSSSSSSSSLYRLLDEDHTW